MFAARTKSNSLPVAILDVIPNPVLVKDAQLRYVWVNPAFERFFNVRRADLFGRLDADVFPHRQALQCAGSDRRVLEAGEMDETRETVFTMTGQAREMLTRKSQLVLQDGTVYLVGVLHDLTDLLSANAKLTENQASLEAQTRQLSQIANTDELTGAMSRYALMQMVQGYDDTAEDYGVLMLDLDHFKNINDTYGHSAGDAALAQFCDRVQACLGADETLARIGGEEFVVIVPKPKPDALAERASQILKSVADTPFKLCTTSVSISVSIGGVYVGPEDKRWAGQTNRFKFALKAADRAMYCAKRKGRNQMCLK